MKKKLATCFESSKSLFTAPTHPTESEQQRIKNFIHSMPVGSNVAHNRTLQRRSSKSRPLLIQLLFHATSVATLAMDVETIAAPTLLHLLQQSGVPAWKRPQRALHHLSKVVAVLLECIQSLGVAAVQPLLANLNLLKTHQEKELKSFASKHKDQLMLHGILTKKQHRARKHKSPKDKAKSSQVCHLPPLASRPTFRL